MSAKADTLVKKYLQLRDKKAEIQQKHKEELAPYNEAMEKIEAMLLQTFEQMGVESVKTRYGTPYISLRETVSVASRDDYIGFVKENEAWEFLESRANKSAVLAYKEEHGELPPGINYRAERKINVRSK